MKKKLAWESGNEKKHVLESRNEKKNLCGSREKKHVWESGNEKNTSGSQKMKKHVWESGNKRHVWESGNKKTRMAVRKWKKTPMGVKESKCISEWHDRKIYRYFVECQGTWANTTLITIGCVLRSRQKNSTGI